MILLFIIFQNLVCLIYGKKNLIQITGLREGEKEYEKLISSKEKLKKHKYTNQLGLVLKNNKKIKDQTEKKYLDSRFSNHLNVTRIKKVFMKEKIIKR